MTQTNTAAAAPATSTALVDDIDFTITALADLGLTLDVTDADTLLLSIADGELCAQHLEHLARLVRADFSAPAFGGDA